MSRHQPYKNLNKFLITDRSSNHILRPVQVKKENYPYTYYVENLDADIVVTIDRAWTPNNHLVLDFIGNKLHSKAYKHVDEKNRKTWKNEGSQGLLFKAEGLLRYSNRETIIKDELKPLIPRYKKLLQLEKSCDERNQMYCPKQLSKEETDLLRTELHEKAALESELLHYLNDLDDVKDLICADAIRYAEIEFKIDKLFERYHKFFKNRRKEYIKDLIKKTSEVRFTLEYPLRVPVIEQVNRNGERQSIIKSVDLQNIKIENDIFFIAEINGNSVKVIFNTFLGRAYLHNILTLNTDWFEEDYLKLDGYASAIYRRFFVTRSGNKFDQLPIEDVVKYFDFLKNSRYPAIIKKAFEDIKNAGLIHNYKFHNNGGRFSKGYIEVVKSSKSIQDNSKSAQENAK